MSCFGRVSSDVVLHFAEYANLIDEVRHVIKIKILMKLLICKKLDGGITCLNLSLKFCFLRLEVDRVVEDQLLWVILSSVPLDKQEFLSIRFFEFF